jgi:hypothetical protein
LSESTIAKQNQRQPKSHFRLRRQMLYPTELRAHYRVPSSESNAQRLEMQAKRSIGGREWEHLLGTATMTTMGKTR